MSKDELRQAMQGLGFELANAGPGIRGTNTTMYVPQPEGAAREKPDWLIEQPDCREELERRIARLKEIASQR